MDSILESVISKHAENYGISKEEAVKIYKDYNREINLAVDNVVKGNIKEIRVPHVMRFVLSDRKYEIYKKAAAKAIEQDKIRESQSED
jgi:1-aminocyclopropane-1-carboxylate deaminase/D-cysteine desulfhydrase-like pyridoxal-dependent ACC family enzyme